jgi:hypothetical protein
VWFIPILIIGAIVIAASRSPREMAPPQLSLVGPPPPAPTGPISTLAEYARVGSIPPPMVILCAIAEAEATGREDIASDIVHLFVAPVVHQHELAARQARETAAYAAACAAMQTTIPTTTPIYVPAMSTTPRPPVIYAPRASSRATHDRGSCTPSRSPRSVADTATTAAVALPPAATHALAPGRASSTDAEIRAMLSADPSRFFAMMTRPAVEVLREDVQRMSAPAPISMARPVPEPPPLVVIDIDPGDRLPAGSPESLEQPTGLPSEVFAQIQEAVGLHEAADQTRAMAPGSPIASVPDDAWRTFVSQLSREDPTFSSSRHVGQYRQCRDRLEELGIDPRKVLDSSQSQRSALDVDLADAHHHAVEGGLLAEHVGRRVAVPGRDDPEEITLSGVLGVIQCAGLDNATNWLERPGDRKRYPHTTQAFLRTNGVF